MRNYLACNVTILTCSLVNEKDHGENDLFANLAGVTATQDVKLFLTGVTGLLLNVFVCVDSIHE